MRSCRDDLVVDIGTDGILGRLDFEGISLADTLQQMGLDTDADAVSQVSGGPVIDGSEAPICWSSILVQVLEAALRRLFNAAS